MFQKLLVNVDEDRDQVEMLEKAIRLAGNTGRLELFCCVYQPILQGAATFNEEAGRRSRHAYMVQCEGTLDHLAERTLVARSQTLKQFRRLRKINSYHFANNPLLLLKAS